MLGALLLVVGWASRRARGPMLTVLSTAATLLVAEGVASGVAALRGPPPPEVGRNPSPPTTQGVAALAELPVAEALTWTEGRRPARRPGVARVLLLGDSFAAGAGVGAGEDLGAQLVPALASRGSGPVEVVVHARPGLDFWTEHTWLLDDGLWWAPDVVVWLWVLNDLQGANPWAGPPAGLDQRTWDDLIMDRSGRAASSGSALVDLLGRIRRGRRVQAWVEEVYARGHDPAVNGEELDLVERALAEVSAALAARGARLVVAIHPLLHDLVDYPFVAAHAEVARRARRAGAEVVDLLPVFEGQEASALWASPTDHHPSAAAHAASAAWLAEALGTLPAAEPPSCEHPPGAGADADLRRARCEAPEGVEALLALARQRAGDRAANPLQMVDSAWLARLYLHEVVGAARLSGGSVPESALAEVALSLPRDPANLPR